MSIFLFFSLNQAIPGNVRKFHLYYFWLTWFFQTKKLGNFPRFLCIILVFTFVSWNTEQGQSWCHHSCTCCCRSCCWFFTSRWKSWSFFFYRYWCWCYRFTWCRFCWSCWYLRFWFLSCFFNRYKVFVVSNFLLKQCLEELVCLVLLAIQEQLLLS